MTRKTSRPGFIPDMQMKVAGILKSADDKLEREKELAALKAREAERKALFLKDKAFQISQLINGFGALIAVVPMLLISLFMPPYDRVGMWGFFALASVAAAGWTIYAAARDLRKLQSNRPFTSHD